MLLSHAQPEESPQPPGPDQVAMVQQFTIDEAQDAGAPQRFHEQMERLFSVGLSVSACAHKPLHTMMRAYSGPRLRFASLRLSPHHTASSHSGPRSTRWLVSLQKEGEAILQQDGRETRAQAGDIVMIDPSRPFHIETGEMLTHSVYIEPEALRSAVPGVECLTARAVTTRDGGGAVYRAMLDEMFRSAASLRPEAADRLADALPWALAAALSGLDEHATPLPPRLKLLHKQRIQRFVRDNLRNPELDGQLVAAAVNLSTRYVYQLFKDEQQPLMKWIWQQRLARCRADLGTPSLATRSIGEIAYYWGFQDLAHFSRSFRQMVGQSPREFRAACLVQSNLSA